MRAWWGVAGPLAALLLGQAEVAAAVTDGQACRAPSARVAGAAVHLLEDGPLAAVVPGATGSQQAARAQGMRYLGSRMAGDAPGAAWTAPLSRWLDCVL